MNDEYRDDLRSTRSVEEVRAWIESRVQGGGGEDLNEFIWCSVASGSPHFDQALVAEIISFGGAIFLADNPALGTEERSCLTERAVEALISGTSLADRRSFSLSHARTAVQQLLLNGHLPMKGSEMSHIRRRWEELATHRPLAHRQQLSLVLVLDPTLTPEELQYLVREDPMLLEEALQHPASSLPLWQEAVRRDGGHWHALVEHPEARQHPEIRPLILEAGREPGAYWLLQALAADRRPEEFREILHLLVAGAPPYVADLLRQAPEESLRMLTREDLLTLLESSDSNVRLAAITLLSHREQGYRGAPPAESRQLKHTP